MNWWRIHLFTTFILYLFSSTLLISAFCAWERKQFPCTLLSTSFCLPPSPYPSNKEKGRPEIRSPVKVPPRPGHKSLFREHGNEILPNFWPNFSNFTRKMTIKQVLSLGIHKWNFHQFLPIFPTVPFMTLLVQIDVTYPLVKDKQHNFVQFCLSFGISLLKNRRFSSHTLYERPKLLFTTCLHTAVCFSNGKSYLVPLLAGTVGGDDDDDPTAQDTNRLLVIFITIS